MGNTSEIAHNVKMMEVNHEGLLFNSVKKSTSK